MSLSPESLQAWATDPEPSEGELVFDFVAGQIVLVVAAVAEAITGSVDELLDDIDADAAGEFTSTDPVPETPTVAVGGGDSPRPRARPRLHCVGHLSIPVGFSATSRVVFDVAEDDEQIAAFL